MSDQSKDAALEQSNQTGSHECPSAELDTPIEKWCDAMQNIVGGLTHFKSVTVLRETDSTQDAAAKCPLGSVVTAGRQRSGRGRLGNRWADTGGLGLAVTFVVQAQPPDRLAMASAVATATALRSLSSNAVAARIGVKWPNDIVVASQGAAPKKIAGILIEGDAHRSLIGIGVNVGQTTFEGAIAPRAISLTQLGQTGDRLAVLARLAGLLDQFLSSSDRVIEEAYEKLDRTAGLRMKFLTPQGVVEGVVLRCEASIGLLLRTDQGVLTLPSATTRVHP